VLLRDWFFPASFEISEQQYFQPWLTNTEKGFWFVLLGWLCLGVICAFAMWISHKAVNCLKSWKQNPLETLAWLIWTLFIFNLVVHCSWRILGGNSHTFLITVLAYKNKSLVSLLTNKYHQFLVGITSRPQHYNNVCFVRRPSRRTSAASE